MIISHRYKFIFIKTRKTAGTSVEIALSKFCGPDDIITRISSVDEKLRRSFDYPGAQNCYKSWREFNGADWFRQLIKFRRPKKFYNHTPATLIRDYVGGDIWNSYYKFCFERNPWDKAVSLYYWRNKTEPRPHFEDFIRQSLSEFSLYSIDGKIAVDHVYRFEEVGAAMQKLADRLGLPEVPTLSRTKNKTNKNMKGHYKSFYDESTRDYISREYSREIDLMGYEF
jgi:hypothetical protein